MDLKEVRTKSNLSQAEFAKTIGTSASSVANIEAGQRNASPKIIEAVKNVYGVEIEPEVKKAAKPAEKKAAKPTEKKAAKTTTKETKAAEAKAAPAEKKVKPAEKKAAPAEKKAKPAEKKAKPAEKKAKPAEKKANPAPAAKKTQPKKAEVIIQSPMGGEITPEAILEKVGSADKVYVRVDVNKAYWVKGEESGDVNLW